MLFERAWQSALEGRAEDYVTGNNDADGPYLLQWVRARMPQWEAPLRERLVAWGGNSSGVNVANIDNLGNVHPDTMWWHHDLGNVRQRPFSGIWSDTSEPLMAGLKAHPRPVGGRCAQCALLRASAAATPACAPSSSPATPGPKTPAAICATTRSGWRPGAMHSAWPSHPLATAAAPSTSVWRLKMRKALHHWIATAARLTLGAGLLWMGADMAHAQAPASTAPVDAAALYGTHCASCHGALRTGGMGPALLPESLERLRKPEALRVIQQGRPATQMPGFADTLSAAEVNALAAWVYQPVTPAPAWSDDDIRASRTETAGARGLPARPAWKADPMNIFVVVEGGDHHVSVLDGDRFEVIHRFASRYALHGGPKFTPDGRFVFFGSRDGWITKYDLWNLTVVAEVRAGLNMRNVAVSGDGRWVMAANYLPRTRGAVRRRPATRQAL